MTISSNLSNSLSSGIVMSFGGIRVVEVSSIE